VPPKKLTVGPFLGINDTRNLSAQDARRAAQLINLYSPAAQVGGDLISRPGMTRLALGAAVARTGTATTGAMTAGTSYTVTGTSTLFTTEFAVGDVMVSASGAEGIITAIASATSCTVTCEVAGTMAGALTYYPAGVKTGPIYGVWNYQTTDGTVKRFLLVETVVTQISGAATAGRYRFITGASTAITGVLTATGFPNGSTTVTGSGTAFLTQLTVGDIITFFDYANGEIAGGGYNGGFGFRVVTITSNTSIIVDTVNTGTGSISGPTMTKQGGKGLLVEYDPSNTAHPFTNRTSTSMNAVALSITGRIYASTFANYFVITDGTNRPRKITSAFVLSNLTDANYAFGGPFTSYYGKLFGIDASDNVTIRWCEENDPDTGWGTGTSDNSWTLRQTSSDQLTVLVGSNEALYCARQNSWAIITGAANSDFRSSGTVDAVQTVGCRSPDAALLINSSVVFLDQYGRPGRIEPGYGYLPLWKRTQETIRGIGLSASQLRAAWGRYDPVTNLIKFAYRATSSATANGQMLVFDADSWECIGTHVWYASGTTAMDHAYSAVILDETNRPRHAICPAGTSDVALYIQKTEDDQAASSQDTVAAGAQMVPVTADSPWLGGDPIEESQFNRVAVNIRNVGGGTAGLVTWKLAFRTPNGDFSTPVAMVVAGTSGTFADALTKAEMPGLNAQGRAMQVRLTNDTSGNTATRATLDTITILAQNADADYARR